MSVPDSAALAAANICPETGLATDYLNHFNEVAMLIEMLPVMADAAADIVDWQPRTYPDHFHATGFRAKELAILAFETARPEVLLAFSASCRKVEAAIADIQARLAAGADPEVFAGAAAADLYDRIATVGAVILGHEATPSGGEQDAVDALFD